MLFFGNLLWKFLSFYHLINYLDISWVSLSIFQLLNMLSSLLVDQVVSPFFFSWFQEEFVLLLSVHFFHLATFGFSFFIVILFLLCGVAWRCIWGSFYELPITSEFFSILCGHNVWSWALLFGYFRRFPNFFIFLNWLHSNCI